jgi:predicted HTH transcriptional regulator
VTIFGVHWEDLGLADVERFLAEAEPEPLLWEAKGIEAKAGEVPRQVCGFANSHDGGFLIIGAAQNDDESWTLDGVEFNDEPPTWVANVIGNGSVNPYPDGLDTKSWATSDGKHVAVVRVPPTPTPPCNANGTVFERVSGRTISVREPLRLAQLFARGDQARTGAQAKADEAARSMLIEGQELRLHVPTNIQFGLGLAAAGYLWPDPEGSVRPV